jgi:hypothetical protein
VTPKEAYELHPEFVGAKLAIFGGLPEQKTVWPELKTPFLYWQYRICSFLLSVLSFVSFFFSFLFIQWIIT